VSDNKEFRVRHGLVVGNNVLVANVTSNTAYVNDLVAAANVSATYFVGNGAALTGIVTDFSPAFNKANAAYTNSNGAFGVANSAHDTANNVVFAFNTANAAYVIGNSAYNFANSVNTFVYGVADNAAAAFAAANNVAPQVTPAFNTANTAYTTANAGYSLTNTTYTAVNSAFGVINSSFSLSNTTANNLANTAVAANNYSGAMANSVNSYAESVGVNANTYASSVAISANAYSDTLLVTARAYTNTSTTAANNYAGVMANSANTYADGTYIKLTAASQTITGNLSITGNLTLLGGSTIISSNNLSVGDSLIYLAANNYSGTDFLDIGFIANYGNTTGANVHTGLVRDATDKQYYLFNGYDQEPANNTFVPGGNNMVNAVLVADINTSNLTLGGANAIVWIKSSYDNSNGAFDKVNSVATSANNYAGAMANSGNAWTQTIVDANLVTARAYTNTSTTAANNYAGAMANSANAYAAATYSTITQLGQNWVVTNAAFTRGNTSAQLAFFRVAAGGTNLDAVSNADTLTISSSNNIVLIPNATNDSIQITQSPSGVTATTYGGASAIPVITIDAFGRVTAAANQAVTSGGVTSVATGVGLTGGTITTTGTVSLATYSTATNVAVSGGISSITVDEYGRVRAVSGSAGYGTGTVTDVSGTTGRITSSGGTAPTIDLATAGAGAATYSTGISAITVDAYGRVTSVTGSAGYVTSSGVTSVSGTGTVSGLTLSGTVTSTGSLTLGGTLSASIIDNMTDEHRLFNNMGDIHSTRTSFDATNPSYNFGWRFIQGSGNGPGVNSASQYYSEYIGLGNDYVATGAGSYGMQIAYPRNVTTPYIAIRYNENNTLGAWQKISAGFADTVGSITSGQVTTALGYTPYNSTNPSGYITSSGSISGSAATFTSTTQNSQFNSIGVNTGASGTAGEIRATNEITAYFSDKRLKTVISPIESPLEKLMQLYGVIYKNNDLAKNFGYDDDKEHVGVLAQDVEKVLPQIVKRAPFDTEYVDGKEVSKSGEDYKTVQYDKLVPLLIEAIKEQQKQIEFLSDKVNSLRGKQ
jgi:hypothetical protein